MLLNGALVPVTLPLPSVGHESSRSLHFFSVLENGSTGIGEVLTEKIALSQGNEHAAKTEL